MKRIGLVYHPLNKRALATAERLARFLEAKGFTFWLCSAWEAEELRSSSAGTDLIVTFGGDGTVLRAAQVAAACSIPITAVNLGKLGFITELTAAEAEEGLMSILDGKGWCDERAMLEAELSQEGEGIQSFYALNDVVLARGEVARIIYITASIDGEELATYRADGVIVATATGSTGYALAAGGPILPPQSKEFLLVPISPHLSLSQTLVLAPEATVSLRLATTHPATLNIDGHISLTLKDGACISVKESPLKTRFLRIHPSRFYGTLERKLKDYNELHH